MAGWPYPATVVGLFVVVLVRANATYWLGRAARGGAARTRVRRRLDSPGFARAEAVIERWGAPVIALSFLTVGFQTLVNLAAGAARMPLRRYLPAMVVGGVAWAFLYATAGFVGFEAWSRLWERSAVGAVTLLVVVVSSGLLVLRLRSRKAL